MTSWLITTFFALVFQRAMKYWEKVIYTKTKQKKKKSTFPSSSQSITVLNKIHLLPPFLSFFTNNITIWKITGT